MDTGKEALSVDNGPRKVLLVLASTYPRWRGDPEPGFVHELAKRLRDRFRVIVVCPHAPGALGREILDGVEVVRYRYAPERWETLVNNGGIVTNLRLNPLKILLVPGFVLAQAWHAWRIVRREQVVVHAHWLVPQGVVAALMRVLSRKRPPFIVTSHGADLHALTGALAMRAKRFVVGQASLVTVVSEAMRKPLSGLGAGTGEVLVAPMGVDMKHRFIPSAATIRSDREILFVGRMVEKKGAGFLLEAMPEVLKQFPDATLKLVGFGPEEAALKERSKVLRLEGTVTFVGPIPQDELPPIYQRAAVFVAPFVRAASGDEEGLGLVLVEAVGCDCPVIAGNVPAVAEVFGTHFPEVTVDPHDTNALANRILEVLTCASKARQRAASLRSAIEQRFDWDEVATRYGDLLEAVMAGVQRPVP